MDVDGTFQETRSKHTGQWPTAKMQQTTLISVPSVSSPPLVAMLPTNFRDESFEADPCDKTFRLTCLPTQQQLSCHCCAICKKRCFRWVTITFLHMSLWKGSKHQRRSRNATDRTQKPSVLMRCQFTTGCCSQHWAGHLHHGNMTLDKVLAIHEMGEFGATISTTAETGIP